MELGGQGPGGVGIIPNKIGRGKTGAKGDVGCQRQLCEGSRLKWSEGGPGSVGDGGTGLPIGTLAKEMGAAGGQIFAKSGSLCYTG